MTFDELFLWALDNGIELTVSNKKLQYSDRLYCASFRYYNMDNSVDVIGQEFISETPEYLLKICEHNLEKLFNNLKMKKPRRKKK